MRNILFTLLALMACTLTYAEIVKIGDLYYSLGATTAQVVKDQSSGKTEYSAFTMITIPASVTYNNYTYPVTSIGTSAFEALTNLQSVSLSASITAINSYAFEGCTKYQAATVWKDFLNIVGVATDLQFEDMIVNVTYLKADSTLHYMEVQNWQVPHAPRIEGFTFLKWQILPGDLADGIVLQAVYEKKTGTDVDQVIVREASGVTRKLIREGNVYILRDDKLFTISGQTVR